MGQNRRARRKAGAEQRDAEERKRFEEFLRQVHLEGDEWEEGPGEQVPFAVVPYIELTALSPLKDMPQHKENKRG